MTGTDELEIDLDDIGRPFSLELFETATATEKEAMKRAVACRTRARIETRRAKSEEVIAEILPADIPDGEAWHVLSSGDVDSLTYLAHLLKTHPMDYVALSTWCMAMEDVKRLSAWLAAGQIRTLDAYVGEIFPNQYADEHAALCEAVKNHGGRVCVFRNHSKIYLCRSADRHWVIESSANINTNPRAENTVITADAGLYSHHLEYFNGVRSFERQFDAWAPSELQKKPEIPA